MPHGDDAIVVLDTVLLAFEILEAHTPVLVIRG